MTAEFATRGIRVNSVAPGIITTAIWEESRRTVPGLIESLADQVALKRWGDSDDVADAVLFFCSDLSRYVTGETLLVDGGMGRVGSTPAPRP